jgi:hypothetical protein
MSCLKFSSKEHSRTREKPEAEDFAWDNGCVRIEITSGEHRAGAHAFYEAIGYKQDSRRFIKSKLTADG